MTNLMLESPKLLSVVASLNSNRSDVHYTVSALRTRSSS
jgi:hypothetical protein